MMLEMLTCLCYIEIFPFKLLLNNRIETQVLNIAQRYYLSGAFHKLCSIPSLGFSLEELVV